MKLPDWTVIVAGLLSMMIGCLLLSIGVVILTPDDWLVVAGLLPTNAAAEEVDAPPPIAITITPIAMAPVNPAEEEGKSGVDPLDTLAATPTPAPTSSTPKASPTAAPTPTSTATPAPTVSAEQVNFVADLMRPLVEEAARRRAERERADPQGYARRIDKALNQNRLNFIVFGYGTTYELPFPPTYKGSIAIYSLDMRTLRVSQITLNHDIRAPEIERYVQATGRKSYPTKIDLAYQTGGFDLMRLAVEDATGLSIDFQLAFKDSVVKNVVDDVFGGLIVDVPYVFEASPIVDNDALQPALHYAKGKQKLNGLQALQFIKATNAQGGTTKYDPNKELAVRKQIIVQAALDTVKKETTNPIFWAKMLAFLRSTLEKKDVEYDFDATTLLFKTISQYVASGARSQKFPITVTRNVYVVDYKIGDGGVQWLTGSLNPIMVRDLKSGIYPDVAISVPLGKADPYAPDLPTNYWTSVRTLVRQRLTQK